MMHFNILTIKQTNKQTTKMEEEQQNLKWSKLSWHYMLQRD
jgi:hypothetical protein